MSNATNAAGSVEIDQKLQQIARHQLGLFTAAQAGRSGVSRDSLARRVQAGALTKEHTGVYRFIVAQRSLHQRLLAACLAVRGSVLFGISAALIHGLPVGPSRSESEPHVIVGNNRTPNHEGISVRRTRLFIASEPWHGSRISPVASTIVSLAEFVGPATLGRCIDHALANRLVSTDSLRVAFDQSSRRLPGRQKLLRELQSRSDGPNGSDRRSDGSRSSGGAPKHRSRLEHRVAGWLDSSALPKAKPNYKVAVGGGVYVEVDFAWPGERVALEVSPFYTHGSEEKQRRDIERRALLQAAGWRIAEATDMHLIDLRSFAPILKQVAVLLALP